MLKKFVACLILMLMPCIALAEEKAEIFPQLGHSNSIESIAQSPDGMLILTGSYDHSIKLWDAKSGKEIRTFAGHTNEVKSVAISPDGRFAVSGSDDQTLRLWNMLTGKEIWKISTANLDDEGKPEDSGAEVIHVAFSADGKRIFAI